MNDNSDLLPNFVHEDAFEVQMRGYSRRQVDEFITRCRGQIRDLEQRLARAHDESEQLKRELATTRQQALGAKPAHEEVSERISQILKLADDEARSQKSKAHEDIARQRNDAQTEAEKIRTEAREQAERMLTAAQEQAERAITSARAEAEKTVTGARNEAEKTLTSARNEAERTTTDARKKSESALASAKAQAKKALDEATARATAIHDGAERRLNLLSTRHAETIKRLTDILDGVSSLVAAETARMSLEEEVDQATAKTIAAAGSNGAPRPGADLTGSATAARPAPGGPRPAAPGGPARPAAPSRAPSQTGPGQPAQPQAAPSPAAQSQQKPAQPPARPSLIDPDEQSEGVRLRPRGDNLGALCKTGCVCWPSGPARAVGAGRTGSNLSGSLHNANFCIRH
jgi:cell division septum initiation protein DivIVA